MVHFTISAPGKVILHGEHAVVYGKRALAASLGLRTYLTLSTSKTESPGQIKLNFTSINLSKTYNIEQIAPLLLSSTPVTPTLLSDAQYTQQLSLLQTFLSSSDLSPTERNALLSFLFLLTCILSPADLTQKGVVTTLTIEVRTELTVSAGLGSSASFLVCVAASMLFYKRWRANGETNGDCVFSESELKEFSSWAFNAEKIIHGTPSGVDNTICTFGALVEFRKGFAPISLSFPDDTGIFKLNALLVNTKIPKDTKKMVAGVANLNERYPNIVRPILEAIDETTASALEEFKALSECLVKNKPTLSSNISEDVKNSCSKLKGLFPINQYLLSSLGVSHNALDRVCTILGERGIAAKLTGAGGGGYAIALVPAPLYSDEAIQAAVRDLEVAGYEGRVLQLGGLGVRVTVHNRD